MANRLNVRAVAGTASVCALALVGPVEVGAQPGRGSNDADRAARILDQARGTSEFMCGIALRSLGNRYGDWYWMSAPDAATDQRDLLEWAANRIERAEAVPVLSDALSDRDLCVRRVAARLLGQVEHPQALNALLGRLESSNAETRQMAAIGLGYQEKPVALDALVTALKDQVSSVRAAAAWALGEIEDPRAIEALARVLEQDGDPTVRRQAARALGEMH